MKASNICTFIILSLLFVTCKEYDDDSALMKNTFRVKQIIEYNDQGEENSRDVFSYENERIILWQWFLKNENGELEEIWKVVVSYDGDFVHATKFYKENDAWKMDKESRYLIYNNLIHEELKTRYGFNPCIECWKYNFKYSGSKLQEWKNYLKSGNDTWELFRKGQYLYEHNKLIEYRAFEMNGEEDWKQNYKRTYSFNNEHITGWQGGTYNAGVDWQPSQKIEYSYENNNISALTYSVWNVSNGLWQYFGSLNYFYDEDNNLIEETTSFGCRTLYEYEEGQGNAAFLYYEADEFAEPEPICKNATRTFNYFASPPGIWKFNKR